LVQAWCEQALASLPEQDSSLRAQLLAQQSLSLVFSNDEESTSAAAFAMAQRVGDDQALRIAMRARQVACATPEGHTERLALGEQMLGLGRRTGDLDAVFWDICGGSTHWSRPAVSTRRRPNSSRSNRSSPAFGNR